MERKTKRLSSSFNPEKDTELLSRFKSGNIGIDRVINNPVLIDNYYKNQLNIKVVKTQEEVLAIAIYRVIEIGAIVEPEFPEETSNYLFIEYFAVNEKYSGNGIGTLFFEDLFEDFNKIINLLNLRGIALSSVEEAIKFYEKLGFELFTKEQGKTNLMLLDSYDEEAYNKYFEDFF